MLILEEDKIFEIHIDNLRDMEFKILYKNGDIIIQGQEIMNLVLQKSGVHLRNYVALKKQDIARLKG